MSSMGQLKGKTAIVTGAAQGIGLAIAKRFHGEGANAVACDINPDKLSEAADLISADGNAFECLEADITGVMLNVDGGRHMATN